MSPLHETPLENTSEVVGRLFHDGYAVVNNVLPPYELSRLSREVAAHFSTKKSSRRNGIIAHGRHRYIAHTMLVPGALNVYTSETLLAVADEYCEDSSHLSNHRIYRNLSSYTSKMVWHKDNKRDDLDSSGRLRSQMDDADKGLILILYLNPVKSGGLQFIPGTHKSLNGVETFSEKTVDTTQVLTLNNVEGGVGILYDYRIIHRAEPVRRPHHRRDALFAQMSPSRMPPGEPIVARASDLASLSPEARRFLSMNSEFQTEHAPHFPIDNGDPGSIRRRLITFVSR